VAERNHYAVLGVGKMASADDLQAHYLQKMNEVHPDRNPGDPEQAMERTIEVVEAYRVLSDPAARKQYDFRAGNQPLLDGEIPGMKLLKSKEKKEAEQRFGEGVRFLRLEDHPKAVEAFKAALKLEPSYSAASYNLALVGALLGNGTFALEVLAKAAAADPKHEALLKLKKSVSNHFFQA
jgi:curved DNA-binding protein CbpA